MKPIKSLTFPSFFAAIFVLFLLSSPTFHATIINDTIISRTINGTADQVWPYVEDFCNIYLYAPLDASFCTKGLRNEPGLVRFIVLQGPPPTGGNSTIVLWEEHLLTAISSKKRRLALFMLDTNREIPYYDAVFQVLVNGTGSQIQLTYNVDLGEYYTLETVRAILTTTIVGMADNIELAIASSSTNLIAFI